MIDNHPDHLDPVTHCANPDPQAQHYVGLAIALYKRLMVDIHLPTHAYLETTLRARFNGFWQGKSIMVVRDGKVSFIPDPH